MRAGIVKPSGMSFWAELLLTVLLMMALMIVVVSIADAIAAELPERWDHLGHEAIEERAPVLGKEHPMRRPTAAAAGDLVAVVTDQASFSKRPIIKQPEPVLRHHWPKQIATELFQARTTDRPRTG